MGEEANLHCKASGRNEQAKAWRLQTSVWFLYTEISKSGGK